MVVSFRSLILLRNLIQYVMRYSKSHRSRSRRGRKGHSKSRRSFHKGGKRHGSRTRRVSRVRVARGGTRV